MTGYIGSQEIRLNNLIDNGYIDNTTSDWTKSNSSAITLTQGTDYVTYETSTTTSAEIYKNMVSTFTYTESSDTYSEYRTSIFYVGSSYTFDSTTGYFTVSQTTYIALSSTGASNATGKYIVNYATSSSTQKGPTVYYIVSASYNSTTKLNLTLQTISSSILNNQIIYAQVKVKSSSSNSSYPMIQLRRNVNGTNTFTSLQSIDGATETNLNDNQWHVLSTYLQTYNGTNYGTYDRVQLQFNSSVVDDTFDFKDIFIINLTEAFGSGNEPDKAWCDEHISQENNAVICFQQSGVANKIQKMYIGIDGVAHIVKKAYIGIDNVAKLWYSEPIPSLAQVFSTMNDYLIDGTSRSTATTASIDLSNSSSFVIGADIFLFLTVGGSLEISRLHVDSLTSVSKTTLSLTADSDAAAQSSSISGTVVTTDNDVNGSTWGAFWFDSTYSPRIIEYVFRNCYKSKLKYYYNSSVASTNTSSSNLRYPVDSLNGSSGIILPMFTGSDAASTVTWYDCFSVSTCSDPLTVVVGAQGSSWLTTRPAIYQATYSSTNYLYPTVTGSAPVKNCRSYCLHNLYENW